MMTWITDKRVELTLAKESIDAKKTRKEGKCKPSLTSSKQMVAEEEEEKQKRKQIESIQIKSKTISQ